MALPIPLGVSADIEGLKTKKNANLVAEEVKQVVPGQVRQKLMESTRTCRTHTAAASPRCKPNEHHGLGARFSAQ